MFDVCMIFTCVCLGLVACRHNGIKLLQKRTKWFVMYIFVLLHGMHKLVACSLSYRVSVGSCMCCCSPSSSFFIGLYFGVSLQCAPFICAYAFTLIQVVSSYLCVCVWWNVQNLRFSGRKMHFVSIVWFYVFVFFSLFFLLCHMSDTHRNPNKRIWLSSHHQHEHTPHTHIGVVKDVYFSR